MKQFLPTLTVVFLLQAFSGTAQHSIARRWNEKVLDAISRDLSRPTIHARNLFHTSIAMYDAWAVYQQTAETYLLGKTVHGFTCGFHRFPLPADIRAAQEEAISFAVYRILKHRFVLSPGAKQLFPEIDALMDSLGYQKNNTSTNYKAGAAEMGNYIAKCVIEYGLQDGSNEANNYASQFYKPANPPLRIAGSGNPTLIDFNRWQPLEFVQFTDQSGNSFSSFTPPFVSPEWGNVAPFALQEQDRVTHLRNGDTYTVYHDPGPPAQHTSTGGGGLSDEYMWNYAMVALWSALLDPADPTMIDVSPASIGNVLQYPTDLAGLRNFYDAFEGGDTGTGRSLNPKTGQPYTPQWVRRGDYTRILAEFWADGPNSVTPPGHWFKILNYVSDQPSLGKRIRGTGPLCDNLEWDVKTYFALGGAMHDAAITAWSIKGWYDSARPVSAIRAMAELGQSSDPNLPGYNAGGLPLIPGYIELVQSGDPLAGVNDVNVGKVKVKTWLGPTHVSNPKTDVAGVGWLMATDWWPYQRPTFVTPPFAGYISGHSTYSRAAAELLTELTADPFFPGGMGSFFCPKNEFLVFEDGPSTDVTLQWATYRDASDQCSLSRIYGGIHPPMDDMPGRLIGMKIGPDALKFAEQYFTKTGPPDSTYAFRIFPNPTSSVALIETEYQGRMPVSIYSTDGRLERNFDLEFQENQALIDLSDFSKGIHIVVGTDADGGKLFEEKVMRW